MLDLKRKLEDANRRNLSDLSNSQHSNGQIATEHNLRVKDGIDYFQRKQHISSSTSKLIEVVNESSFFNRNNLLKRNHQALSQTAVKAFSARPISEGHIHKFGRSLERAAVLNHYQTPVKERKRFQSRQSMENLEIMKLTPSPADKKANQTNSDQSDSKPQHIQMLSERPTE